LYTYNTANQLTEVDGQAYTWDNNGNLISDSVRSFVYDAANRLTAVDVSSNTVSFGYNGDGDRVKQINNNIQTDYVLDPVGLAQVLIEISGDLSGRWHAHRFIE
jgi:YD repeat-containing protein